MNITRAVVIAMDSEVNDPVKMQRMDHLRDQVRALLHVPLEIWPASTGPDPAVPLSPRVLYTVNTRRLESVLDPGTRGALGCATSHIKVLQSIPADDGWTLVLESDASFVQPDARSAMSQDLARLLRVEGPAAHVHPSRPGMIVLQRYMGNHKGNNVTIPGFQLLRRLVAPWLGTTALLVRNSAAGAFVDSLLPVYAQIDGALGILASLGAPFPIWTTCPSVVEPVVVRGSTTQRGLSLKVILPPHNDVLLVIFVTPIVLMVAVVVLLVLRMHR